MLARRSVSAFQNLPSQDYLFILQISRSPQTHRLKVRALSTRPPKARSLPELPSQATIKTQHASPSGPVRPGSTGKSRRPDSADESGASLSRRLWRILPWLPVAAFVVNLVSVGTISGGSMSPTLNPDYPTLGVSATRDVVVLNRKAVADQRWRVGDVVVFVSPLNPNMLLTKRILALPGDVVRFLDTQKVPNTDGPGFKEVKVWSRVRIPPGRCWLEGDSSIALKSSARTTSSALRSDPSSEAPPTSSSSSEKRNKISDAATDVSHDSRHFGPVPLALLTAKVPYVLWPPSRFGPVPHRPGCAPAPTPGKAGGNTRGWWPFSQGNGRHQGVTPIRPPEDSVLTPYLIDHHHEGDEESVGESVEDDTIVLPVSHSMAKRIAATANNGSGLPAGSLGEEDGSHPSRSEDDARDPHRGRSALSEEHRQQIRSQLNTLSRGGKLGDTLES